MNREIRLGMELEKLKNSYFFEKVCAFIFGETKDGAMYFSDLKPLFDEYGYTYVISILEELYENYKKERGGKNNE